MNPETPPAEPPKAAPPAPIPAATPPQPAPAEPSKPAAEVATPTPPTPAPAEPPKGVEGLEFTEVSGEPAAPTTVGKVIQPVVMTTPGKKAKKPKVAGAKGPTRAILFAILVFVLLAGFAYYAYTKSK